jgi:hypothetical protein
MTAWNWSLNLLGDEITLQTAGANLQGDGRPPYIGFYLFQIRLPGAAGVIFRMAHRIPGDRVLSANIASP